MAKNKKKHKTKNKAKKKIIKFEEPEIRDLGIQFVTEILASTASGGHEWHRWIKGKIAKDDCVKIADLVGCWVRHEDGMTRFYLRW